MKVHLVLILVLASRVVWCQTKVDLLLIKQGSSEPISYASVSFQSLDSQNRSPQIKISNQFGRVQFIANSLNFHVLVSHINFHTVDTTIILEKKNQKIQLTIRLFERNLEIDTIVVRSDKSKILLVPGGYEYVPGIEKLEVSRNAMDILRNLPGIVQGQNSKLSLMGQPIILWVDGEEMKISGDEVTSFLKSLNAHDIKQVRVYTTPPSIFDASSANVVEIITKRNIVDGLLIRVDGGVQVGDKENIGFVANYKNKAYSGNLRTSYSHEAYWYEETVTQKNMDAPDSTYSFDNSTYIPKYITNVFSVTSNQDFAIGSKNTLGFVGRLNIYDNPLSNSTSQTEVSDRNNQLQSIETLLRKNKNNNAFIFYGLNYRHSFSKVTSIIVDASRYLRNNKRSFDESFTTKSMIYPTSGDTSYRFSSTSNKAQVNLASFTLSHLIKKNTISFGGKFTNVSNRQLLFDEVKGISNYSNNYTLYYDENIIALFSSLRGSVKRLRYDIGLRWESTNTKITAPGNRDFQPITRLFSNLFPSFSLTFSPKDNLRFSLGARRSIIRISYDQLNPFDQSRNSFVTIIGNPELKPIFQYSINLSANKTFKKGLSANFQSRFSISKNSFFPILLQDTLPGHYIQKYLTYKGNTSLYNSIYLDYSVNDWFKTVVNTYGYATWSSFNDLQNLVNPKPTPTFGLSLDFYFTLPYKIDFQLSSQFETRSIYVQGDSREYYGIDLSAGRAFLNEKLSVIVGFKDPFNSVKMVTNNNTFFIKNRVVEKEESRICYLSLSYRIGKTRQNKIRPYNNQDDQRFIK
jgi:hypothetical protein